MAFWCFLYVYQRVAGFFPDFPHTVPGRRTSKGGFCAAQRLQSLRWGKFTLPQAGHSQFPFSPSDQTRYPIRSIPGCWLDWKGLTRHGSRDPIEKSEIANRSSIQSSIQSFLKIQPPPQKKKTDFVLWWFPQMEIPACYRSLPFVAWATSDGFSEGFWFSWNSQSWTGWWKSSINM